MPITPSNPQAGRRRLLKLIAAGGGSLAASTLLPGKWLKPAMRVGVLPVHAQTSPVPTATRRPTSAPATAEPTAEPTIEPTIEPTLEEPPTPIGPQYSIDTTFNGIDAANDGDWFIELYVQITPPDSGIDMRVTYTAFEGSSVYSPTGTYSPGTGTLEAPTGNDWRDPPDPGLAWLTKPGRLVYPSSVTSLVTTFSFVDDTLCTTGCTQTITTPLLT